MTIEVGDKARIAANTSGHTFEVGTIVTVHCMLSPMWNDKVVVFDSVKADIVALSDLESLAVPKPVPTPTDRVEGDGIITMTLPEDTAAMRLLKSGARFRRDSAGRLVTTPTPSKDDSIEQATGSALDTWGWALDCPRKPGETDDAYRKALLLCCRWEHDSVEEWEAARARVLDRKVEP